MIGRIEDLKLEWVFETIVSTLLPILIPLFFMLEEEQGQEQQQLCDFPGHICHPSARSTKELFSYNRQKVDLKTLRFCAPDVGWGKKKCLLYRQFEKISYTIRSTECKSVFRPIAKTALYLNFLLTSLLKSHVPFALRNNESYLF